jgi:Putative zinc-finger
VNHEDVKQNLGDYLEGDLSLETRASVDAHLDGCVECAQEVDEMQRTIRLLRTLPDPETPPMIAANVMRRIRAGETQPSWFGRIGRSIGAVLEPTFVLPASAIAVAGLVVMVVQEPGFLNRFAVGETTSPMPGAIDIGRSPAARPRAESEIAGLDLSLPQPFDALARSGAATSGFAPARPPEQSLEEAASGSPAIAPSGSIRYRFEFDAATSRGAIRATPSSPAPLASSFASRGASAQNLNPPRTMMVGGNRGRVAGNQTARAQRVAQPTRGASLASSSGSFGGSDSFAGEDARDEWLARGLDSPVDFARFLAGKNLAEHELWVSRLAERARERGLLTDLVEALRTSGDTSAAILSDDFAAQADASVDDGLDVGVPYSR